MYRLIFLNGKRKGRRLAIRSQKATIGSDAKCSIAIDNPALAGEHALIEQREGGVYLRSLCADGVVKINGLDVGDAAVHDGDVISVGPIRFRFRASSALSGESGRRRGSNLQRLTLLAVLVLLLLELALLFGWSFLLR
jgi:pSer/pThr/pTyr-binding forkhead associated (FHA) protein